MFMQYMLHDTVKYEYWPDQVELGDMLELFP